MRSPDEVQRAHDVLVAVVTGEVPDPFPDEQSMVAARAGLDVLCWVLHHDHNQTFARNLEAIVGALVAQGYVLSKERG